MASLGPGGGAVGDYVLGASALTHVNRIVKVSAAGVVSESNLSDDGTTVSYTGALILAAGGSNQNVTLTPSGSGYTILNGNVGIGTTAPGGHGSGAAGPFFDIYGTGANGPEIYMGTNSVAVNSVAYVMGGYTTGTASADKRLALIATAVDATSTTVPYGRIDFYINNGGSFSVPMTIKSSGNVGIGTVSPGYKLDVAGDINTSTVYRVAGTQVVGARGSAIPDIGVLATSGDTPGATYSQTIVEHIISDLIALKAKQNTHLGSDRTHGLIAP
jgi:hypothetical protein